MIGSPRIDAVMACGWPALVWRGKLRGCCDAVEGRGPAEAGALIVYPAKCSMKRRNPIGAKPSLLVSFQIFPDQRTHIFAKIHRKRSSFSLRLQMQRRRQGNRNPKRNPSWAPGRFCFFGPASTTFVCLHTLYVYCTYRGRATLEPPYEAFRIARRPSPLSPYQSRPGPNQRALAIYRRG